MGTKKRENKSAAALDWRAVWDELSKTSDRAAAIVGEAILEQSLSALISNYLVDNEEEASRLLSYPGTLSSLYGKSNLAYCLGLITQGQLDDLRAINKIRNHFAHRLHGASFKDVSIRQMMGQIEPYKRFLSSDDRDLPRKQFNAAISTLAYALSVESARAEHQNEKKAKSVSELLNELATSQSKG